MNRLPQIASRDNQRLTRARRIRDGRALGMMFIEGKRLVIEALRSDTGVEDAFVSSKFADSRENADIIEKLCRATTFVFEIPDRIFGTIAGTENSQGIIVLANQPKADRILIEKRLASAVYLPLIVYLSEINNPSNLGAVVRTAEAANVAGIFVSDKSADPFSPKALRAAMGSSFRVPIIREVPLSDSTIWGRERGLDLIGTSGDSCNTYDSIDWTKPSMVYFGSEGHGLPDSFTSSLNDNIRIPMANDVESLNIAVSAGIVLFEACRQFKFR